MGKYYADTYLSVPQWLVSLYMSCLSNILQICTLDSFNMPGTQKQLTVLGRLKLSQFPAGLKFDQLFVINETNAKR